MRATLPLSFSTAAVVTPFLVIVVVVVSLSSRAYLSSWRYINGSSILYAFCNVTLPSLLLAFLFFYDSIFSFLRARFFLSFSVSFFPFLFLIFIFIIVVVIGIIIRSRIKRFGRKKERKKEIDRDWFRITFWLVTFYLGRRRSEEFGEGRKERGMVWEGNNESSILSTILSIFQPTAKTGEIYIYFFSFFS